VQPINGGRFGKCRDAAVLEKIQRRLGERGEPRRDINVRADRAAAQDAWTWLRWW
jgi:hypothetical protein